MANTSMRQSTLETLGLGSVLDIFARGQLPVTASDLVDEVFGEPARRGSLVISGANGIVGAGKAMQLGSRLRPFDVPIVALDFANAPDGIGKHYGGLVRAFGRERASKIMEGITRLSYDGKHLPPRLKDSQPRFLLEAIPEVLDIKKSHYEIFRAEFPHIEIRSVTSGFPSSQLGVPIAHPAFPHEVNKVWEIIEPQPSRITQLFWALGLIPTPVSDHWSFVLDVLFCGLTLAGLRYHHATNMPFWKIDKYIRRQLGPNPFRAHDAIGAKGANFLTWSCLHHLAEHYGDLFKPTEDLDQRRESGQNWYPPNHFRPVVNWKMQDGEQTEFEAWISGALIQMTSLMLHEARAHLSHLNIIGELCAQFRHGILADIRRLGADAAINTVHAYQVLHPQAAKSAWYPDVFEQIEGVDWQQLYVNAEHDGSVGVITVGRESYNHDVDAELNRAIDWLKAARVERVIITGDFHLSTQMIGADTDDFFPALQDETKGRDIARSWSETARRLHDEFRCSVAFVNGKRCLGGFLELMMHCHYMVAVATAELGMPEVTLPVVPGMEGCHWPFRKAKPEEWPRLLGLLLTGELVRANDTVGWLVDYAGPVNEALKTAWKIVTEREHDVPRRVVEDGPLKGLGSQVSDVAGPSGSDADAARRAIVDTVLASCQATLAESIAIQAKHSARFMTGEHCRRGVVGAAFKKTMTV